MYIAICMHVYMYMNMYILLVFTLTSTESYIYMFTVIFQRKCDQQALTQTGAQTPTWTLALLPTIAVSPTTRFAGGSSGFLTGVQCLSATAQISFFFVVPVGAV